MITRLASSKQGGAFSNLGGDVDSMIEHGQEAYALVKKLLNVEVKAVEAVFGAITPDYGGVMSNFSATISQGVGDTQRTGDSLKYTEFVFNGRVSWNTAGNAQQSVRMLLVFSNDEAMTAAEMLALGVAATPFSTEVWDSKSQYRVIKDELFTVNASRSAQLFRWRISGEHLGHTQFSAGSTTVLSGCLQMLTVSDQAGANYPSVIGYTSIRFVDN